MDSLPAQVKSHYEVLGVPADASSAVIRTRFNALIELETQKEGGGEHTRIASLSTVYAVLSDPVRRRDYDEALTGRPSLLRSKIAERMDAQFAEKVQKRRAELQEQERLARAELKELVARGAAKAPLAGSHRVKGTSEGAKPPPNASKELETLTQKDPPPPTSLSYARLQADRPSTQRQTTSVST
mmetsp:Transcript_80560/g.176677  ORF Transcript_80560/g.176677 Transcript_80560/m.176677 type:complete len:185 (-) Transcript_80560:30-584(-)